MTSLVIVCQQCGCDITDFDRLLDGEVDGQYKEKRCPSCGVSSAHLRILEERK